MDSADPSEIDDEIMRLLGRSAALGRRHADIERKRASTLPAYGRSEDGRGDPTPKTLQLCSPSLKLN